jgi:hypothetical protein
METLRTPLTRPLLTRAEALALALLLGIPLLGDGLFDAAPATEDPPGDNRGESAQVEATDSESPSAWFI